MSDLEQKVENLLPEYEINLQGIMEQILTGNIIEAFAGLIKSVIDSLSLQALGIRNILVYLLVLGIISALLSHFTEMFENHQVADISFYFVYLLLMAVLLRAFTGVAQVAYETVTQIVTFIRIFIPTYFLAMGVSGNAITAYVYYELLLFLIYGVEALLLTVVLPLISSYVFLSLINGIWAEERLVLILDFLHKTIQLIMKSAIGIVTGISLLQSMITPVIDSVKSSAVQKTVSAIPGIGNVANSVVEMMVGSSVLIKNSVGVVILILLLVICIVPLIKVFVISGMLKLGAALMGVICDKRITGCKNKVGEGSFLLLRTMGTALFLFLITIAIAAYTTNRGF